MPSAVSIPIIDLSTFFLDEVEERKKKKVTETIKQACSEYGLFQIVNHGLPIKVLNQATEQCKQFFDLPNDDKLKVYTDQSDLPYVYRKHKADRTNIYVCHPLETPPMFFLPIHQISSNLWKKLFNKFSETCQLLEGILNDSLGLPPNLLKDYNDDRCMDILLSYRYFLAMEIEDNGANSHQDPAVFSLIFQDDAGGLEVLIDGQWIPVDPLEGALVFHIGDVLQVLTNDKFVSPFHQVVRPKGRSRYVFVFFYNLNGEKWEPLPQFTEDIGEIPKYRKLQFKDYFGVRVKEKLNPPARQQDKTTLLTFASAT